MYLWQLVYGVEEDTAELNATGNPSFKTDERDTENLSNDSTLPERNRYDWVKHLEKLPPYRRGKGTYFFCFE